MRRYELSDQQWNRISSLFRQRTRLGKVGRPPSDHRPIVNGILGILHTGAPWRDLPGRYGPYTTAYNRFNRWRKAGIWDRLMNAITKAHDGDVQTIVNGILGILHTGAPWRDRPERYGPWQTVFTRFNGWRRDGTWARIATSLLDELDDKGRIDHDLWCIDGSVIRASRAAAGGGERGPRFAAAGRTQAGATPGAV